MGSSFDFTDQDGANIVEMSVIASGVSLGFSLFILLAALWIYSKPTARHVLDRLSFRLMLWSMAFEAVYDLVYCLSSIIAVRGARCSSQVYFLLATLGVVNFLCTAIAINLMLIISFGIHPRVWNLERWYVGVSIGLGMGIPIIPTALQHFGWDPIYEDCWFRSADADRRILQFVLDLYLWQSLSCLIAAISVITTLATLFRQSRATSQAIFVQEGDADPQNVGTYTSLRARLLRMGGRSGAEKTAVQTISLGRLEDKFFSISLRISTYPVALILVNGVITAGDLYFSKGGGVNTYPQYVFFVLYNFLYAGRGLFFSGLGIFVDPCLAKGLRAAWNAPSPRRLGQLLPSGSSELSLPADQVPMDLMTMLTDKPTSSHPSQNEVWSPRLDLDPSDFVIVLMDGPCVGALSVTPARDVPIGAKRRCSSITAPLQDSSEPLASTAEEESRSGVRPDRVTREITHDTDVEMGGSRPGSTYRLQGSLSAGRIKAAVDEEVEVGMAAGPEIDDQRERRRSSGTRRNHTTRMLVFKDFATEV